jgi:hypothetical protein
MQGILQTVLRYDHGAGTEATAETMEGQQRQGTEIMRACCIDPAVLDPHAPSIRLPVVYCFVL